MPTTGRAKRPTYKLRRSAWTLLADQDPKALYQEGPKPEPNLSAIARQTGLSQSSLIKLKNDDQGLTIDILAALVNFLVTCGWDRVEAQEALLEPVRFATARSKRRLVAV